MAKNANRKFMKKAIWLCCITMLMSCQKKQEQPMTEKKQAVKDTSAACIDGCESKATGGFTCKLTTPELQKRKATIIESLRKQLLEKKELKQGYAFRVNGSDKMVDEL